MSRLATNGQGGRVIAPILFEVNASLITNSLNSTRPPPSYYQAQPQQQEPRPKTTAHMNIQ